jgi:hypothetical protein
MNQYNCENFSIKYINNKTIKKFNAEQISYTVKFLNLPEEFMEFYTYLKNVFDELIEVIIKDSKKIDRIKFYINHPALQSPISLPFVQVEQLTSDMIFEYIKKILQSNKNMSLDEPFTFEIIKIKMPSGSGKNKSLNEFIFNKRSLIQVKNNDNMCALRAIVIGKAKADNSNKFKVISSSRKSIQTTLALKLAREAKVDVNAPCGLEEIQRIENYLIHYQIFIIDANSLHNFLYIGPTKDLKIFLYYHDNHYDVITKLNAFFSSKHYCFKCLKPYMTYNHHPCNAVCKKCKMKTCSTQFKIVQKCEFCGVSCNDQQCLINHIHRVCGKTKKCDICGAFQTYKHICYGKWCEFCKIQVENDHKCYIINEKATKTIIQKPFKGYIFFDYEAMQVGEEHVPNLIVANKVCLKCLLSYSVQCTTCENKIWKNNIDFCNWLFSNKHCIAIAHNMKSYDGYFIMQYIVKHILPGETLPECLMTGNKLLVIKFRDLKIIDSYNFLTMSLSKLPKTFGFEELKKGYFPHFFNTIENQNYVGNIPEKDYYGFKYFNNDDRNTFEKWYESKKESKFNLQTELLEYCQSDVDILKRACLEFRRVFMSITKLNENDEGVDPFLENLTIASVCHLVYRRNFMAPNSIALIPESGYARKDSSSFKSKLWLKFISIRDNIFIQHSLNGYEKRIGIYKVDGYCESTDTIFEFHGCFFHGCVRCFSPETYNKLLQKSMCDIFSQHNTRIDYLRQQKTVIELWECEYDILLQTDTVFANFVKHENIKKELNPRDSLYGGRTNASILYYEGNADYVDFTSLYPCVQKYGVFPVGHPKILTENFLSTDTYFGLIMCSVLPPKDLLFPVLPLRINNKLVFTLCNKCAELKCHFCNHSDDDRMLEGTWVTLEINEAVKRGYIIKKIYEIWHWENNEQYDIKSQSKGLFTSYVNTFLKLKQEASGFPNWVKNNEDKVRFCNDYLKHEGISLDINKIRPNAGAKTVAKLMLNSHWGRYAMNSNKIKCQFVSKISDLYKYFIDQQYNVHDVHFPTQDVAIVFYTENKLMQWGSNQTNVVIASFVTCQARLKLYYELEKLGKRVIYFDTDSIIYIKDENDYTPKIGDYLGEFTNEIEPSEGEYIVEFASTGPKVYSYKTNKNYMHTKVKGFTLNYNASQRINFETFKYMLNNKDEQSEESISQNNIIRSKKDWKLMTRNNEKIFKMVYDKRIILPDLSTIPYGFNQTRI